jgi:hypothetical protein
MCLPYMGTKPAILSGGLSGVSYIDTSGLATLVEVARVAACKVYSDRGGSCQNAPQSGGRSTRQPVEPDGKQQLYKNDYRRFRARLEIACI